MVKYTLAVRALFLGALLSTATAQTAFAQSSKADDYASLLQQISDQRASILQQEYFLTQQQAEIESLRTQISEVPALKESIGPLLDKMAAQMEDAINADLPFLREERLNRIGKLKNDLRDAALKPGDRYRSALTALKIEVNYGMGVEGYEGPRPLNAGEEAVMAIPLDDTGDEKTNDDGSSVAAEAELGTYLRYGRVALVWLNQRTTSARRYDVPTKSWIDVKGGELNDIRKAVRISRGEVAPAVVMVPTHLSQ